MEKNFSLRGLAKIFRTALPAASSAGLLAMTLLAAPGNARGAAISGPGENFSWHPEKSSGPGREGGARGVPLASNQKKKPVKQASRPDSRTVSLGLACRQTSDCRGRTQVCLKEQDANGKELEKGICALPCAPIDAGLGDPLAPTPENVEAAKRPPPPRCPKQYQCRSAGSGVPIDLCVKE